MYSHLKAEQECFDEHGNVYIFQEATATGAVVRRVFTTYEGEYSHEGAPAFFHEALFDTEVTPKLSASFAALQQEAKTLRDEVATLRADKSRALQADHTLFKSLENREAVHGLLDFIQGKMKFLAYKAYGCWKIEPIEKALETTECRSPALRLLSLYGRSKGNLSWRRHAYSDGSGNDWHKAQPALTYEDALVFVRFDLHEQIKEVMGRFKAKDSNADYLASCLSAELTKYEVDMPPEIAEAAVRYAGQQRQRTIETARKEIAKYQKVLADHGEQA